MSSDSRMDVRQCPSCGGYFEAEAPTTLCPYCLDTSFIPVGVPLVKGAAGDPDLCTFKGPGGRDVLLTRASWVEGGVPRHG